MLHHMMEHIFRLMNLFGVHLFNLCVMLEFESKQKEKKMSKANGKQIEKGKQNQPNSPSSSQPNSAWRPIPLPRPTLLPPCATCARAQHPSAWPRAPAATSAPRARPIRAPGPTSRPPSPWAACVVGPARVDKASCMSYLVAAPCNHRSSLFPSLLSSMLPHDVIPLSDA